MKFVVTKFVFLLFFKIIVAVNTIPFLYTNLSEVSMKSNEKEIQVNNVLS